MVAVVVLGGWTIFSKTAVVGVLAGAVVGVPMPVAGVASASTCQVRIAEWAFHPSSVEAGGATTLKLTLRNCTERTRQVSVTWFGSGPNCPTIDPAPPTSVQLGPEQRLTEKWRMQAPPCGPTGGEEDVTVRVADQRGKELASRTTTLTVTPA